MSHAIPIRVPPLELPSNSFRLHTCEKYPPKSFGLHTYEIALPQVLWIAYLRNKGGWGGVSSFRIESRLLLSSRRISRASRPAGECIPLSPFFSFDSALRITPQIPTHAVSCAYTLRRGEGVPPPFSLAYFHRSTPGLRPSRTPAQPGFPPPGPHHRSRILGRRRRLALTPHLIACAGYPGGRIILPSALDPRRVAP